MGRRHLSRLLQQGSLSTKERKTKAVQKEHARLYLSPRELATRWRCSRSTVDRIAKREGLARLCLGEGRNGIIRYLREEVEDLQKSRLLTSQQSERHKGYIGPRSN